MRMPTVMRTRRRPFRPTYPARFRRIVPMAGAVARSRADDQILRQIKATIWLACSMRRYRRLEGGWDDRPFPRSVARQGRPWTSSEAPPAGYNRTVRRRKALVTTRTELMLIAALAIIGLSSKPIAG